MKLPKDSRVEMMTSQGGGTLNDIETARGMAQEIHRNKYLLI